MHRPLNQSHHSLTPLGNWNWPVCSSTSLVKLKCTPARPTQRWPSVNDSSTTNEPALGVPTSAFPRHSAYPSSAPSLRPQHPIAPPAASLGRPPLGCYTYHPVSRIDDRIFVLVGHNAQKHGRRPGPSHHTSQPILTRQFICRTVKFSSSIPPFFKSFFN